MVSLWLNHKNSVSLKNSLFLIRTGPTLTLNIYEIVSLHLNHTYINVFFSIYGKAHWENARGILNVIMSNSHLSDYSHNIRFCFPDSENDKYNSFSFGMLRIYLNISQVLRLICCQKADLALVGTWQLLIRLERSGPNNSGALTLCFSLSLVLLMNLWAVCCI